MKIFDVYKECRIEAATQTEAMNELLLANSLGKCHKFFTNEEEANAEYNRIAAALNPPHKITHKLSWFDGVALFSVDCTEYDDDDTLDDNFYSAFCGEVERADIGII